MTRTGRRNHTRSSAGRFVRFCIACGGFTFSDDPFPLMTQEPDQRSATFDRVWTEGLPAADQNHSLRTKGIPSVWQGGGVSDTTLPPDLTQHPGELNHQLLGGGGGYGPLRSSLDQGPVQTAGSAQSEPSVRQSLLRQQSSTLLEKTDPPLDLQTAELYDGTDRSTDLGP